MQREKEKGKGDDRIYAMFVDVKVAFDNVGEAIEDFGGKGSNT